MASANNPTSSNGISRNNRNVVVFGATSFLNDTASEMAYWILPAFLRTLGAGPMQLGIIEGVAESIASAAKLISGHFTDKLQRRKPLVVAGYVIANAVKPLLALSSTWWQILGIRFADRVAKGMRGAPRDVMVAESVDKKNLGAAFGTVQAMDTAGAIVGPLLALLIVNVLHGDARDVFLAAAVPGFLCVLVVSLFARETRPQTSVEATVIPPAKGSYSQLSRSYYWVLAAVGIFSIGNSSDMFLVLRAYDVGIGVAQAPLLGLTFNVVYSLGSWPAGKLSDKYPRHLIAAFGFLVFAMTYAVFAIAPSKLAIWGAMAFYGLYYATTQPVLKALVVESVPAEMRGRALGLYAFVTSVAALLASLIAGFLWKGFGAKTTFVLSATLALIACVMLLLRPKPSTA
jgi:MFS family permease